MEPAGLIARVRDGEEIAPTDLRAFAAGLADGSVSDAQAGAFAMAVVLKGLGDDGRMALTTGMRDSGDVLDWDLPGPVLDKHSTGGVGDCVSLVLAPALAAVGAYVPMVSGRGLGHTGGTLDKLEAIPGLSTEVTEERFRALVAQTGAAIVSATGRIAPADRRLYAIRDVSATVESVDLITASILSKKLAAGIDALILDVKTGSGAFMATEADAAALARALVDTANGIGCPTAALITDMNQPCASSLGNALEVMAAMEALTGRDGPLLTLSEALGGALLVLGGVVADETSGQAMIREAVTAGHAAERFGAMVAAMGGPVDFIERWRDRLPAAPVTAEVHGTPGYYVTAIDGVALGQAVVRLGGGRVVETDRIDPSVGVSQVARLGDRIDGQPLALVHAASQSAAEAAVAEVRAAITLGSDPTALPALVKRRID